VKESTKEVAGGERPPGRREMPRSGAFSYLAYPLLMAAALAGAWLARRAGISDVLTVVASTFLVGAAVFLLERLAPFRADWGATREDLQADALHGLVSNGVPSTILEMLLKGSLLQVAFWMRSDRGIDLWPDSLPLFAQVGLALLAAEVGFYAVHRTFHEANVAWLWRWHAVHHSARRMYFLAGSRTHPVQVLFSFGSTVAILWFLGVPDEVILYKTVFHTAHGIFQHSNLDIRLGFLNWILAGPELHRWHHAVSPEQSNHNYGNNLIVIDVVLGTRFLPDEPVTPPAVGLPPDVAYENTFVGHLLLPLTSRR
jgi:ornithine lipid hydroxylase